ncbi:hypothetical protein B4N89_03260 [Embleya scabrispora]|uniref:Lipoprotein n=1 Tax=Embleya scabrispora TaxID=159449 RepID=A0A1T3NTD8_9ACTN|nr:hypothetical protein [Embleya scabrispora]OPC80099.1 hypothetical protein B4N89_03260 [Embleya scabrispora]
MTGRARPRLRRGLGTAIGGVALLLVTAACGNGSGSGFGDRSPGEEGSGGSGGGNKAYAGPAAAVFAAVDKVHGTESVAITVQQKLPGGKGSNAQGAIKFGDAGGLRMTMAMPQGAVPGMPAKIETLVTPTAMYMNMGSALAADTGGKSWLKMDFTALGSLDKTGALAAVGELMNKGLGQQDPTSQLSLLKGSGDIAEVGREDLAGRPTVHYKGTVDMAKASRLGAEALGLSAKTLESLRAANEAIGATSSTIEVWIDAKTDLPVRQSVSTPTKVGEVGSTVDYRDWGTKVDVTPPPASATVDFQELIDKERGGSKAA